MFEKNKKKHTEEIKQQKKIKSEQISSKEENEKILAFVEKPLKDLIDLLKEFKGDGLKAFANARKTEKFTLIEKQVDSLKNLNITFRKFMEEQKICFFINLHNLLVLFALCVQPEQNFPRNKEEWFHFRAHIEISFPDDKKFTALEIEHAILRASMTIPHFDCPKEFNIFFKKLHGNDPRFKIGCSLKIPLLSFAIYIPTVYL